MMSRQQSHLNAVLCHLICLHHLLRRQPAATVETSSQLFVAQCRLLQRLAVSDLCQTAYPYVSLWPPMPPYIALSPHMYMYIFANLHASLHTLYVT